MATLESVYELTEEYIIDALDGEEISDARLNLISAWAWKQLVAITFGRVELAECTADEIALCFADLAKYGLSVQKNDGKQVNSESVGDWSKSYSGGYDGADSIQSGARSIVYQWLAGSWLLYRGVHNP